MANYIYFRVSTDEQDYTQQKKCVEDCLSRAHIDPKVGVEKIVTEKVSGTINSSERQLDSLLRLCKSGDTIYFSELSRLGRNMANLYQIVTQCCDKGVVLIQAKDGMRIENETIGGKALLFALSLAAEIEVANIRQRTHMGLDARKKALREGGCFVSNSGRICTHLGNEKGADMSAAQEASILSRRNAKIKWTQTSPAFLWVREKVGANWPRKVILEEFNKLHAIEPAIFSTRGGAALSKGVLSQWIALM